MIPERTQRNISTNCLMVADLLCSKNGDSTLRRNAHLVYDITGCMQTRFLDNVNCSANL